MTRFLRWQPIAGHFPKQRDVPLRRQNASKSQPRACRPAWAEQLAKAFVFSRGVSILLAFFSQLNSRHTVSGYRSAKINTPVELYIGGVPLRCICYRSQCALLGECEVTPISDSRRKLQFAWPGFPAILRRRGVPQEVGITVACLENNGPRS